MHVAFHCMVDVIYYSQALYVLTFIIRINTTFESLKAINSDPIILSPRKCQHFSFYEQLKFHLQLS